MSKQSGMGSTSEKSRRTPGKGQEGLYSIANRALIGQLVEPPETAVAAPLQQAVSNLQGGFGTMRSNFGMGGGLADQLAGRGGGGAMLPGENQWGLQTREQLGLPDRKDYFEFVPSADEVRSLGALPNVRPTGPGKKIEKLENRIERRQAAGKGTANAEARLARLKERQ